MAAHVIGRMVQYTYRHDVTPVIGADPGIIALTDSGSLTHRYGNGDGLTVCGRIAARVFDTLDSATVTCQQCSGGDWTATFSTRRLARHSRKR